MPIRLLTGVQRGEMMTLLDRHFEGVDERGFAEDLANKSWALLIYDDAGVLVGFSTLDVRDEEVDGFACSVVYSGDTIVDPSAWSSAALPRGWIAAVRAIRPLEEGRPLLWLLLTSGVRTYRLLTTFWREFVPGVTTVAEGSIVSRALLDTLAARRYGSMYDAKTGIVRLARPQRLRAHLMDAEAGRTGDQHVSFFLRANPGHAAGDELVCLASLEDENLTRAGRRVAGVSEVVA